MSDFQKFLDRALKSFDFDINDFEVIPVEYDVFEDIRSQIINARNEVGLTQKELALKAGVTQANISKIEQGSSHPTIDTLVKIADGLGKKLVIRLDDSEGVDDYD